MGNYITQPDTVEAQGRLISAGPGTFHGVMAQLRDGEILVGIYERGTKIAPVLTDEAEYNHFEGQYHCGLFISRRLFACPPGVQEESRVYLCPHCHAVAQGVKPPEGWRLHHLKDCQADQYYCPDCEEAEAKDKAAWEAAWNDPAVHQKYTDFDAWLAALLPLARYMGYITEAEGVEALREMETWRMAYDEGDTPAQAMKEDLSNAC